MDPYSISASSPYYCARLKEKKNHVHEINAKSYFYINGAESLKSKFTVLAERVQPADNFSAISMKNCIIIARFSKSERLRDYLKNIFET